MSTRSSTYSENFAQSCPRRAETSRGSVDKVAGSARRRERTSSSCSRTPFGDDPNVLHDASMSTFQTFAALEEEDEVIREEQEEAAQWLRNVAVRAQTRHELVAEARRAMAKMKPSTTSAAAESYLATIYDGYEIHEPDERRAVPFVDDATLASYEERSLESVSEEGEDVDLAQVGGAAAALDFGRLFGS